MARTLKAVPEGATSPKAPPKNVKEAAEHSERALLVALRTKAAADIDAGVPAHALGTLIKQVRELDRDIRAIDLREQQEAENDASSVEDGDFDASAV